MQHEGVAGGAGFSCYWRECLGDRDLSDRARPGDDGDVPDLRSNAPLWIARITSDSDGKVAGGGMNRSRRCDRLADVSFRSREVGSMGRRVGSTSAAVALCDRGDGVLGFREEEDDDRARVNVCRKERFLGGAALALDDGVPLAEDGDLTWGGDLMGLGDATLAGDLTGDTTLGVDDFRGDRLVLLLSEGGGMMTLSSCFFLGGVYRRVPVIRAAKLGRVSRLDGGPGWSLTGCRKDRSPDSLRGGEGVTFGRKCSFCFELAILGSGTVADTAEVNGFTESAVAVAISAGTVASSDERDCCTLDASSTSPM